LRVWGLAFRVLRLRFQGSVFRVEPSREAEDGEEVVEYKP